MSQYDIEKFDPPPDPELVCCICQCVLDRPVESPCRHVFCQACIERWLTNRHTCPTCRKRTRKPDLKPVLPLVQNVLNRLMMKCDYRENGCMDKIVLEQFERHIQNCGYEMKTCKFSKCSQKILKMHLSSHEKAACEHREVACEGECSLMIPLSEKGSHNCVAALKTHIEEKTRMIETLKTKLQELNNLSQSLNDQLEQLRQQLDERPRFPSISSFSGSDTDVTDFMSETLSDESLFDETSNQSGQNLESTDAGDGDNNPENTASDVVEQVERTIVTTLFDVSSRLEVVRNQMRAVLDAGFVNDNDNLHIATPALDAIVNNNSTIGLPASVNSNFANASTNTNYVNTIAGRNSSDGIAGHRIMETLNSLISRASDNADHSPEAQDGDVTEYQVRNNSYAADNSEAYQESRDVSYSDQYDNSDPNQYDSDLGYLNTTYPESDDNHRRRSFRYSSHNHSSSDPYSRDDRSLPGHVIVSEPPGSPSNTNSSFLSSSSSLPTISSDGNSPGSHRDDLPADASTPRNDSADDDNWVSDARTNTSRSTASSQGRNTNYTSPRSCQSTPISSPRSIYSGQTDNHNSGPEYNSDNSLGSVSHRSTSVASSSFVSERYEESVHSVSSSSAARSPDGNVSDESREEEKSYENSPDEHSNYSEEENDTEEDEQWYKHRGHNNDTTDEYEEPNDTMPSVDTSVPLFLSDASTGTVEATESDNGMAPSRKKNTSDNSGQKTSDQTEGTKTNSDDESCPTSTHVSIPSDSSDSDKSESMKYLTKRLRHGTKETSTETKNESKTVECDKSLCTGSSLGKSDVKVLSETSTEKNKVDSSIRNRHSRKRRGAADVCYQGSQCKKASSGSSSYGTVAQQQQSSLPSQTTTRSALPSQTITRSSLPSQTTNRSSLPSQTTTRSALPSQTTTSAEQRQQARRTRSSTIQASSTTQDNSSQSLNVKIDLSLINYSGQMVPQTVSGSAPSATVVLSKTAGTKQGASAMGDRTANTQNQRSGSPRGGEVTQSNTHRQARYPRRRGSRTRCQTRSSSPVRHSYNTRTFPHSWIDNSDQSESSDDTYVPGSDCHETDVTITEEEGESDTSYEVQIPKTTADLLQEYGSNDSDESWTVGMS